MRYFLHEKKTVFFSNVALNAAQIPALRWLCSWKGWEHQNPEVESDAVQRAKTCTVPCAVIKTS